MGQLRFGRRYFLRLLKLVEIRLRRRGTVARTDLGQNTMHERAVTRPSVRSQIRRDKLRRTYPSVIYYFAFRRGIFFSRY